MITQKQFPLQPILETQRLILRPITMEDVADIFEYASIPEVTQYLPWGSPKTIDDTKIFIEGVLKNYNNNIPGDFGLFHKEYKKIIGTIGFPSYVPQDKRIELGYCLSPKYWGQGFMPEATKKVLAFCFHAFVVERVEAYCVGENKASARVLEKAGMQQEGTLRKRVYRKGRFWDQVYYSILREEFEKLE